MRAGTVAGELVGYIDHGGMGSYSLPPCQRFFSSRRRRTPRLLRRSQVDTFVNGALAAFSLTQQGGRHRRGTLELGGGAFRLRATHSRNAKTTMATGQESLV
ncbi:hypothetical protein D9M68_586510 [compost metagenome]